MFIYIYIERERERDTERQRDRETERERASLVAQMVKSLPAMWQTRVWSLGQEDPWRRQPTPVFLPGESYGWCSLTGYSPWGLKESEMTEQLSHTHTHTHTHKIGSQQGPTVEHRELYLISCIFSVFSYSRKELEKLHKYNWISLLYTWSKQYCKSTVLQSKIKIKHKWHSLFKSL